LPLHGFFGAEKTVWISKHNLTKPAINLKIFAQQYVQPSEETPDEEDERVRENSKLIKAKKFLELQRFVAEGEGHHLKFKRKVSHPEKIVEK